jgi:hypothetical protein
MLIFIAIAAQKSSIITKNLTLAGCAFIASP